MPNPLFKLEKEKFSSIDNEQRWTYRWLENFIFNGSLIVFLTITDHPWKKKGREMVTKELILNIFWEKLNGQEMKPFKKHGSRDIYVWEWVYYQKRFYHLTFWFEDNNSDWLWVRNCYPIS